MAAGRSRGRAANFSCMAFEPRGFGAHALPSNPVLLLGIFPEGAFSKKVPGIGSKLRFDTGEKKMPTEGEPLKTKV